MSGLSSVDIAHAVFLLEDNLRDSEKLDQSLAQIGSSERDSEWIALLVAKRERVSRFKAAFDAAIGEEAAARSAR